MNPLAASHKVDGTTRDVVLLIHGWTGTLGPPIHPMEQTGIIDEAPLQQIANY